MEKNLKKQKVLYDSESDILWIVLKEGLEEEHREVAPNISLEIDDKGEIMGMEILNVSKVLGIKPKIKEKVLESV